MVQYLTISYATVWVCDANKKEMKICAWSKGSMCMCWCESGKQQEVANMHAHPKTEWDCTAVVENPHQQKKASVDFIIAHETKVMYHWGVLEALHIQTETTASKV